MTDHPPIRIHLQLPQLTPAQAHSLCNLLQELASQIWDAYETEILDFEDAQLRLFDDEDERTEPTAP